MHCATGVPVGVAVEVAVGVPDGVAVGVPDGVAVGVAVARVKLKLQFPAGVGAGISWAAGLLDGLIGEMEVCLSW